MRKTTKSPGEKIVTDIKRATRIAKKEKPHQAKPQKFAVREIGGHPC